MSIVEKAIEKGLASAPAQRQGPRAPRRAAPLATPLGRGNGPVPAESVALQERNMLLVGSEQQDLPYAEAYRRIKRPLLANAFGELAGPEGLANVLAVTSAREGAGKTMTSLNLAASIASEKECSAILIDADVIKPTLSAAFGAAGRFGLTDLLNDTGSAVTDALLGTNFGAVKFLPAGKRCENATELLASRRMADVIAELARLYPDHLVILDTPPLLMTTEAQVLADVADQILFVVESGVSTHEGVQSALRLVDADKPVNLVLNKASGIAGRELLGGYQYGYGYR